MNEIQQKLQEKEEKIFLLKQKIIEYYTDKLKECNQNKSTMENLVVTLNNIFNNLDIIDRTDELVQEYNQDIIDANNTLERLNILIETCIRELNKYQIA
jgi:hypothetical protein